MKPLVYYSLLLAFVLLTQSRIGMAQNSQGSGTEHEAAGSPTSSVSPATAVITITGFCEGEEHRPRPFSRERSCLRTISREQFEDLIDALNPHMPDANRRELGDAYPNLLLQAREAMRLGLDRDPRVQKILYFERMRVLARELEVRLQKEGGQVSVVEIQKYYLDHAAEFEQLTLRRIFIPPARQIPGQPTITVVGRDPQMEREAQQIQARAATGADFDVLQQEVFKFAGMLALPPNTKLGKSSRAGLPPGHSSVFDLPAGGVSQVISDPAGYYVYKVEAKTLPPISTVEPELRKRLAVQNVKALRDDVLHSAKVQLNNAYFKPLEQYVAFGGPLGPGEQESAAPAAAEAKPPKNKSPKAER